MKAVMYYSSPGERLMAFTTNGRNDNITYTTQPNRVCRLLDGHKRMSTSTLLTKTNDWGLHCPFCCGAEREAAHLGNGWENRNNLPCYTLQNSVISFSSFSSIEEAEDVFCKSATLRLLDAELWTQCGSKLVEDDPLTLAAAWLLFLAAGTSWLCFPSYVVMTAFGSWDDLSICFFTSHPWYVHL